MHPLQAYCTSGTAVHGSGIPFQRNSDPAAAETAIEVIVDACVPS